MYIWTVLWGMVMLLPRKIPKKWQPLVYMSVSAVHGLLYGILYAPVQAFVLGMNLEGTIAWIMAGLPWDVMHGVSNFVCGILILPIIRVMRMAERSRTWSGD